MEIACSVHLAIKPSLISRKTWEILMTLLSGHTAILTQYWCFLMCGSFLEKFLSKMIKSSGWSSCRHESHYNDGLYQPGIKGEEERNERGKSGNKCVRRERVGKRLANTIRVNVKTDQFIWLWQTWYNWKWTGSFVLVHRRCQ